MISQKANGADLQLPPPVWWMRLIQTLHAHDGKLVRVLGLKHEAGLMPSTITDLCIETHEEMAESAAGTSLIQIQIPQSRSLTSQVSRSPGGLGDECSLNT